MVVGDTHGSDIVSIAADFRWMSVVHGIEEYVRCVCGWRGLCLGITNPVVTGRVLYVYLFLSGGHVEWVGCLDQGLEGWGGVMSVSCEC